MFFLELYSVIRNVLDHANLQYDLFSIWPPTVLIFFHIYKLFKIVKYH